MFVGEYVEVPFRLKVQERPHAVMEGQRALRVFLLGTLERFSNPVRPVKVTNAAWRVLQIRFELKDGMSETLVTDALGFEKTSEENVAMPP